MASTKLTEKRIRNFPYGSGIHRDSDVKGLMVIAHKKTKTYACKVMLGAMVAMSGQLGSRLIAVTA